MSDSLGASRRRGVALLMLGAVLAGCSAPGLASGDATSSSVDTGVDPTGSNTTPAAVGPATSPPTEAEVFAALDYAYRHAPDPVGLCKIASTQSMCEILLDQAPRPPAEAPDVLCTVVYAGDQTHVAGRIARVTGTTDSGDAYETDILAISGTNGALLMNPVYWVPSSVSDSGESGDVIDVDCGMGQD